MGSQYLLQNRIAEASKCFANLLAKEESNTTALLGTLKCKIMTDDLNGVEEQFTKLLLLKKEMNTNPVSNAIESDT